MENEGLSMFHGIKIIVNPQYWRGAQGCDSVVLRCEVSVGDIKTSKENHVFLGDLMTRSIFDVIWEDMGKDLKKEIAKIGDSPGRKAVEG